MARGWGDAGRNDRRRRLLGSAVAAALVAVAVLLAFVGGSGGGAEAVDATPRLVGAGELADLEASLGHPLYWAGERPPARIELREEAGGNVYVRYLPPGVAAGDPEQRYLTGGTYPVADAVAALRRTAAAAGTEVGRVGGGIVLANPESPGSVYLAYPGTDIEVEVYDPVSGRSLRLIRAGAIRPVG